MEEEIIEFPRSPKRSKTSKRDTIIDCEALYKAVDLVNKDNSEPHKRSPVRSKTLRRCSILRSDGKIKTFILDENEDQSDDDKPKIIQPRRTVLSAKIVMNFGMPGIPEAQSPNVIRSLHYMTQAGVDDEGFFKTNQDCYFVNENLFGIKNFGIYGVLDGHGKRVVYF
jgi:hypothetical protein